MVWLYSEYSQRRAKWGLMHLNSFIFHNIFKVNPSLFHIPPLRSFCCQICHCRDREHFRLLIHPPMGIWVLFSLGYYERHFWEYLCSCRHTFSRLLGITARVELLGLLVTLHLTFWGWGCQPFQLGYSFFQALSPRFLSLKHQVFISTCLKGRMWLAERRNKEVIRLSSPRALGDPWTLAQQRGLERESPPTFLLRSTLIHHTNPSSLQGWKENKRQRMRPENSCVAVGRVAAALGNC